MPNLQQVRDSFLDFGEVHYMVDSDYRTIAQGWSRADRTGPLDLYLQRSNAQLQYVFRTADYASDALALQAAIDAQVDFRGDVLLFTPGAYSIATARTIDVPDARWLGPRCSAPEVARASLTNAAVASIFAIGAAADRMEIGFLELIPVTAQTMFSVAAIDKLHVHHIFVNMDGVAASTATIPFQIAASAQFMLFENTLVWCDAAQGPWINCAGALKGLTVKDFRLVQEAGTWAAVIDFEGTGAVSFDIGPGSISGTGGASITSLITAADKTQDTSHGYVHGIRASVVGPAAGSLAVATGLAAELSITDCWRAVDTDAAQPTFTSGGAISWESGVPYTG